MMKMRMKMHLGKRNVPRLLKWFVLLSLMGYIGYLINRILSFHLVVNSVVYFTNDATDAHLSNGHRSLIKSHKTLTFAEQLLHSPIASTESSNDSDQHLFRPSSDLLASGVASSSSSSSPSSAAASKSSTGSSSHPKHFKSQCHPKNHIMFLKTHKTGSSSVQNIFLRYGDDHNLFFALPKPDNYIGHPTRFNRRLLLDPNLLKSRYNVTYSMIVHHLRFNYKELNEIMPKDTFYVTILRDPVKLYESLFTYFDFAQMILGKNVTLSDFANLYGDLLEEENVSDFLKLQEQIGQEDALEDGEWRKSNSPKGLNVPHGEGRVKVKAEEGPRQIDEVGGKDMTNQANTLKAKMNKRKKKEKSNSQVEVMQGQGKDVQEGKEELGRGKNNDDNDNDDEDEEDGRDGSTGGGGGFAPPASAAGETVTSNDSSTRYKYGYSYSGIGKSRSTKSESTSHHHTHYQHEKDLKAKRKTPATVRAGGKGKASASQVTQLEQMQQPLNHQQHQRSRDVNVNLGNTVKGTHKYTNGNVQLPKMQGRAVEEAEEAREEEEQQEEEEREDAIADGQGKEEGETKEGKTSKDKPHQAAGKIGQENGRTGEERDGQELNGHSLMIQMTDSKSSDRTQGASSKGPPDVVPPWTNHFNQAKSNDSTNIKGNLPVKRVTEQNATGELFHSQSTFSGPTSGPSSLSSSSSSSSPPLPQGAIASSSIVASSALAGLFRSIWTGSLGAASATEQKNTKDTFAVPDKNRRIRGRYGRNQMAFDLGFNPRYFDDARIVNNFIDALDSIFHLVLINEKMDESLILLKHLLCWSLDDVIAFEHNRRSSEYILKEPLSPRASKIIRSLNMADQLIYNHFYNKLNQMIEAFGMEKMAREVDELRRKRSTLYAKCVQSTDLMSNIVPQQTSIVSKYHSTLKTSQASSVFTHGKMNGKRVNPLWASPKVLGMKVNPNNDQGKLCTQLTMRELTYTAKLRKKQGQLLSSKKLLLSGFNVKLEVLAQNQVDYYFRS